MYTCKHYTLKLIKKYFLQISLSVRPTMQTVPRPAQTPTEASLALVGLAIHWVMIVGLALVRRKPRITSNGSFLLL